MSMPETATVTCRQCRHQEAFVIWKSLNVSLNPEKKAELLSGALTRFTCPRCQWSSTVAYPMLYHDMEKRYMVWVYDSPVQPDAPALPPGVNYHLRIVAKLNDLFEKIRLFDTDTDDRVMELFKLYLQEAHLREIMPTGHNELYFRDFGRNSEGDEVLAFMFPLDRSYQHMAVNRASFNKFAISIAPNLDNKVAPSNQWLRIDRAYAETIAERFNQRA
jgi:hypothetical protein